MTQHFTTSTARTFPHPRAVVFKHWHDPQTRVRWEAGPDTGMAYENFDTREGGRERIRITQDGKTLGVMDQAILVHRPPELTVASVRVTFGNTTAMVILITVAFGASDDGRATTVTGTSQVVQLVGAGGAAQQEDGWAMLFDRFAADIAAHGPHAEA